MEIRIGTSGWSYPHWRGIFYPEKLSPGKWLQFYTEKFDTVELNSTFYRLPKESTFNNWKKRTPVNFKWAIKASRFITHIKRLKDIAEPIDRFFSRILNLKKKIGVILFQLPPTLKFEVTLLDNFLKKLPSDYRYGLEVRNLSWIDKKAFTLLKKYNIAFCISDTAGRFPYIEKITTDFIYIRLHGSKELYASDYTDEELMIWLEKIKTWNKDTYIYFDNDANGYAVKNALKFKELFGSI